MSYVTATTDLRGLRHNLDELIRRVEAGETITITVGGRPVAQLCPVPRRQWVRTTSLRELLGGPADSDWAREREEDRELFDDSPRDPFER